MKIAESNELLSSINSVFNESRSLLGKSEYPEDICQNLEVISKSFGISQSEALIFTVIFVLNLSDSRISFVNLTEFFSNNQANVLLFSKDIESLCKKGILRKYFSGDEDVLFGPKYSVNQKMILNVMEGAQNATPLKVEYDLYSLLAKIWKMICDREINADDREDLAIAIKFMLEDNREIPFINFVVEQHLQDKHNLIYIYTVWSTMDGRIETDAGYLLNSIYGCSSERVRVMQSLIDGSNELISKGLLETSENMFLHDLYLKVGETSVDIAATCGITLKKKPRTDKLVINHDSIKQKQLIFNDKKIPQLITFREMLKGDRLKEIQESLANRGFPTGVAALLYGSPGTGKSESVLQLARESGREIMKVDISRTKSMWFGESEKMVKQIFKDYNNYRASCERTPILFINEADALISKRMEISHSNTAQTENTIQNILLEEIENFKGILIATTNLINNIDPAFDRRFLFKIHLPNPDSTTRAAIWRDKYSPLSVADSKRLANEFVNTGGEIENIIRKIAIEEAIYGTTLTVDQILEICESEQLIRGKSIRIKGFNN